jgi:putative membrane protein (TIGR04086 family)
MPKNSKSKQSNIQIKGILIPMIIGLSVFFAAVTVFALVVSKTPYTKQNPSAYLLAASAVSGFISGLWSTVKIRSNGLVTGLITGTVLAFAELLIIVAVSLFSVNQSSLLILPCCILPASVAGIIGVNINLK